MAAPRRLDFSTAIIALAAAAALNTELIDLKETRVYCVVLSTPKVIYS